VALFLIPLYPKIGLLSVPGTYIPVRIDDLLIGGCVAVWLAGLVMQRRVPFVPAQLGLAAAAWVGCGLISLIVGAVVLRTIAATTGLAYWAKPIEYLLLGLIAYDQVRMGRLSPRLVLVTVFASAAGVVAYGVLERFGVLPQLPGWTPNPGSLFATTGDPHELATYLGMLIVLSAVLWRHAPRKARIAWAFALVPTVFVLFSSAGRSEYVAAVVCLAALAFHRPSRKPALLALAVMVVLFATPPTLRALGAVPAPSGSTTTDVSARFDDDSLIGNLKVRFLYKWPAYLNATLRDPLFGLGPSVATEAADGYYVRSIVETGIVGTVAFAALLLAVVAGLRRAARSMTDSTRTLAQGLLAATAFLGIVGILIDTWVASRVMEIYWPLVGTALAGWTGARHGFRAEAPALRTGDDASSRVTW
jgi:O-antigen ligase